MFQEPMLPIRSAPTTEVSLRDSDVAAADMQTIEDGPRGKELEPDNNPQAPVLQQPEPPNKANKWQHLGKSATTRAQSKLGAKPHPSKISTIAIVWNARGVSNGLTRRRLDDLAQTGL
jgi:hypothetical protein